MLFKGWPSFFSWRKVVGLSLGALLLVGGGLLVAQELRASDYQAQFFASLARRASFTVGDGPSPAIRFPKSAPYDDRLGYADLPLFLDRLKAREFEIAQQARISGQMAELVDAGYFAPYFEKYQTGLRIVDRHNGTLFQDRYPERVYQDFTDIPPVLVDSLLYIENRELLDFRYPTRNPAIEWDRLAKADHGSAIQVTGNPLARRQHAGHPDREIPPLSGGRTDSRATSCGRWRPPPCAPTWTAKTPGAAPDRSEYLNTVPLSAAGSARSTAWATACGPGTGAISPTSTALLSRADAPGADLATAWRSSRR